MTFCHWVGFSCHTPRTGLSPPGYGTPFHKLFEMPRSLQEDFITFIPLSLERMINWGRGVYFLNCTASMPILHMLPCDSATVPSLGPTAPTGPGKAVIGLGGSDARLFNNDRSFQNFHFCI